MSTATIEPRPARLLRAAASRVTPGEGQRLEARQSAPTKKQLGKRAAAVRNATDDEILGFDSASNSEPQNGQLKLDWDADSGANSPAQVPMDQTPTSNLDAIFAQNPELPRAWKDASAYRNSFATPDFTIVLVVVCLEARRGGPAGKFLEFHFPGLLVRAIRGPRRRE
jgi:hypothetical protein